MQHPFSILASEYATLLAAMRLDDDREHELKARAATVLDLAHDHRFEWADIEYRTGVPRLWGMASFERESSSDYSRSPAQGDRWDKISVNVPRGLGPYRCWGDACEAAYAIDKLDEVGKANWSWARACYEGELYNGFGPRTHGRHTGYLWSWTNVYMGGKYVADGKWDPDHRDEQCGMVPMMAVLLKFDASLALADEFPAALILATPDGLKDAAWVQTRLNALGADPQLVVDGSYGRATRRAVAAFQAAHRLAPDGLAGPLTIAALNPPVA